jgi:hypothetical protein
VSRRGWEFAEDVRLIGVEDVVVCFGEDDERAVWREIVEGVSGVAAGEKGEGGWNPPVERMGTFRLSPG